MSAPPATLRERTAEPADAGDIYKARWRLEVGLRSMSTSKMDKRAPMRVEIREFQPQDYERLVEISNRIEPEHRETVEEARYYDEHFDRSKYFFRRYVGVDPATRAVVATAECHHMPWNFHLQKYWTWIGVDPDWQRRGIGSALYERVLAEIRERDGIAARTSVRENEKASLDFVRHRGFAERLRNWESHLDVTTFDFSRFAGKEREPEGIRIVTLETELKRDPECIRQVFDLGNAIMPDVPMPDPYTPASYDMFLSDIQGPTALHDGYYLAMAGDAYVGLSNLWRSKGEKDSLFQGLTGVLREYRGRGIAWALKLRTIACARDHGYRKIMTWNNTENKSILAINDRLGFARQPAWITFEKDLAGASEPGR